MKKIIFSVFLLVSLVSYAKWTNGHFNDEWGQPSKSTYALVQQKNTGNWFQIGKDKDGLYGRLHFNSYIGNEFTSSVGIKIDDKIFNFEGWTGKSGNSEIYIFELNKEFLKKIKNGKVMLVRTNTYDDDVVYAKFDLINSTKAINNIK